MKQLTGPDIHQAFIHAAPLIVPTVIPPVNWNELSERSRELYTNMALYLNEIEIERNTDSLVAIVRKNKK